LNGSWQELETEEQFDALLGQSEMTVGSWTGPGTYYFTTYSQPILEGSPIAEVLTAAELLAEVEQNVRGWVRLMVTARERVLAQGEA
jgi:hypothetical protein